MYTIFLQDINTEFQELQNCSEGSAVISRSFPFLSWFLKVHKAEPVSVSVKVLSADIVLVRWLLVTEHTQFGDWVSRALFKKTF